MVTDEKIEYIGKSIREIPDFPKKGIRFQDICGILADPKAFQYCIDKFYDRYKDLNIDVVAGII